MVTDRLVMILMTFLQGTQISAQISAEISPQISAEISSQISAQMKEKAKVAPSVSNKLEEDKPGPVKGEVSISPAKGTKGTEGIKGVIGTTVKRSSRVTRK
jgi:hypothetical protein